MSRSDQLLRIDVDSSGLERCIKTLQSIPGAYEKAVRGAMARTVQSVRQEAVTQTARQYWITAGVVRKAISYQNNAGGGAVITIRGKRLNLKDYKIKPGKVPKKRTPLYAAVKREGGLKHFPRGFLLPLNGGKPYAFERRGKGRWNITSIAAPAVPQIINDETQEAMTDKARETFEKRMSYEMMRAIGAVK